MRSERPPDTFGTAVTRQLRKNRIAMAGLIVVFCFFFVAAFADFIANDKPLVLKNRGRIYFPVLKEYAVWFGVSRWPIEFQNISFKDLVARNLNNGDWAVFPPVRYSPNEVNLNEVIQRPSFRHLFGTDDVGRDVAARIVHGSRVSLSVGFVAVSIYVVIGLLIGAMA